jgi:hypothetical protein
VNGPELARGLAAIEDAMRPIDEVTAELKEPLTRGRLKDNESGEVSLTVTAPQPRFEAWAIGGFLGVRPGGRLFRGEAA